MKIIIVKGDITTAMTDVIVNAANSRLAPSSGECGAIFEAAGYDKLKEACSHLGYCMPGEAVITPGFDLFAKYIIHAVGPIYHGSRDDDILLAQAYVNSLNLAIDNGCLTIAFPAVSTGIYNYPYEKAADIAISTMMEFKKLHENDLAMVYIYCYDDEIFHVFLDTMKKYVNDWKRQVADIHLLEESLKARDLRVSTFRDTRNFYLNDDSLKTSIQYTKANTKLYNEEFIKEEKTVKNDENNILLERLKSFDAAEKHLKEGKIAVLNFASGTHPGGGVLQGSPAQEESLCRISTLYICLNDETGDLYENFYSYHKQFNGLSSDRVIYSPGIVVFKRDNADYSYINKANWFQVDVITCAAPNLGHIALSDNELHEVMVKRIKNIMESAIDNDVDILILGAFGCGAFNNNPGVNAAAFKEVLSEYSKYFKKIVFAIPDDNNDKSANYKCFEKVLK